MNVNRANSLPWNTAVIKVYMEQLLSSSVIDNIISGNY